MWPHQYRFTALTCKVTAVTEQVLAEIYLEVRTSPRKRVVLMDPEANITVLSGAKRAKGPTLLSFVQETQRKKVPMDPLPTIKKESA